MSIFIDFSWNLIVMHQICISTHLNFLSVKIFFGRIWSIPTRVRNSDIHASTDNLGDAPLKTKVQKGSFFDILFLNFLIFSYPF